MLDKEAKKKMKSLFLNHGLDMEIYNLEGEVVKQGFDIIKKKILRIKKTYPYDPSIDDLLEFVDNMLGLF